MSSVFEAIANWLYEYGRTNAGMPSIRGSYEAPVPEQLYTDSKWNSVSPQ